MLLPPPSEQARWFNSEVQPHEASLRAYLQRLVPAWSDVDDVVQESYVRILQAKKRGKIDSPRGLLFAIARNAARDLFRRRSTRSETQLEEIERSDLDTEAISVAETVSRQQEEELLAEAIQSLPERCRIVLTLRKLDGLSQKEISTRLGIAEHTVEIHLLNGLRRCGEYFARRGIKRTQR